MTSNGMWDHLSKKEEKTRSSALSDATSLQAHVAKQEAQIADLQAELQEARRSRASGSAAAPASSVCRGNQAQINLDTRVQALAGRKFARDGVEYYNPGDTGTVTKLDVGDNTDRFQVTWDRTGKTSGMLKSEVRHYCKMLDEATAEEQTAAMWESRERFEAERIEAERQAEEARQHTQADQRAIDALLRNEKEAKRASVVEVGMGQTSTMVSSMDVDSDEEQSRMDRLVTRSMTTGTIADTALGRRDSAEFGLSDDVVDAFNFTRNVVRSMTQSSICTTTYDDADFGLSDDQLADLKMTCDAKRYALVRSLSKTLSGCQNSEEQTKMALEQHSDDLHSYALLSEILSNRTQSSQSNGLTRSLSTKSSKDVLDQEHLKDLQGKYWDNFMNTSASSILNNLGMDADRIEGLQDKFQEELDLDAILSEALSRPAGAEDAKADAEDADAGTLAPSRSNTRFDTVF